MCPCLALVSSLPQKAEDFLRRAQQRNRFAGGAFDFLSGQRCAARGLLGTCGLAGARCNWLA